MMIKVRSYSVYVIKHVVSLNSITIFRTFRQIKDKFKKSHTSSKSLSTESSHYLSPSETSSPALESARSGRSLSFTGMTCTPISTSRSAKEENLRLLQELERMQVLVDELRSKASVAQDSRSAASAVLVQLTDQASKLHAQKEELIVQLNSFSPEPSPEFIQREANDTLFEQSQRLAAAEAYISQLEEHILSLKSEIARVREADARATLILESAEHIAAGLAKENRQLKKDLEVSEIQTEQLLYNVDMAMMNKKDNEHKLSSEAGRHRRDQDAYSEMEKDFQKLLHAYELVNGELDIASADRDAFQTQLLTAKSEIAALQSAINACSSCSMKTDSCHTPTTKQDSVLGDIIRGGEFAGNGEEMTVQKSRGSPSFTIKAIKRKDALPLPLQKKTGSIGKKIFLGISALTVAGVMVNRNRKTM